MQINDKIMKLLSIIIPVYNVEKYVRPCIESLFRQGLNEECFEIIIVNDGTRDRSMEVIADLIQLHSNIIIINQENRGLSIARNNGMARAQGEYIMFIDSDDLLIENSIPKLLEIANEKKPDLVVADYYRMNDDDILKFNGVHQTFQYVEKTGEQMLIEDLNPNECYIWRILLKRNFLRYEQISFVPDIRYEDIPFIHETFIKAKKCIKTDWPFYIYRIGHESITFSFNKNNAKQLCKAIGKTYELRMISGLSTEILYKLEEDIYTSFSYLFYAMLHSVKSSEDRRDIVRFLCSNVPKLEFRNSSKRRIESLLLNKAPYLYLSLREWHWKWITHNHKTE